MYFTLGGDTMEDLTLYQLAASCAAVLESAGIPEEGIFSFRYLAGRADPSASAYGEEEGLSGEDGGEASADNAGALEDGAEAPADNAGAPKDGAEAPEDPILEQPREALSLIRACAKAADLVRELLCGTDPGHLPDAAACAAIGSAAAAIEGCAKGASLHVYAGTRLLRDRTRARSLNSSALRELKRVKKTVEGVQERVFKELTTLS